MKIKELEQIPVVHIRDVQQLAEALGRVNREKIPPSLKQSPSTQATLDRDPSLDKFHSKRGYDLEKIIVDHTIEREIPPDQFIAYESMRRGIKNSLGCSYKSATTLEKKHRAVEAFVHTPPAPLTEEQKENLTKLEAIKELESLPVEEPKKQSLLDRINTWLYGKESNDQKSWAEKSPELAKDFKIKEKKK